MSQPIKNSFSWAPALEASAIIGTTLAATKTTAITWLVSPMSTSGIMVTSAVNALSLWMFNSKQSPLRTLAALTIGATLTTLLAKPLAAYSIAVSSHAILQVTAFNLLTKVALSAFTYFTTQNDPQEETTSSEINLENLSVASLTDDEVRTYYTHCMENDPPKSPIQLETLTARFFKLDLDPPRFEYMTKLDLPHSANELSESQARYIINYYTKHHGEFKALKPEDQVLVNKICVKGKSIPFERSEKTSTWWTVGLVAISLLATTSGIYAYYLNDPPAEIESSSLESKIILPGPGTSNLFPFPQTPTVSSFNPLYLAAVPISLLSGALYSIFKTDSKGPQWDIDYIDSIELDHSTSHGNVSIFLKDHVRLSPKHHMLNPNTHIWKSQTATKLITYLMQIYIPAHVSDIDETTQKYDLEVKDLTIKLTVKTERSHKTHQATVSFDSVEKLNSYEHNDFELIEF